MRNIKLFIASMLLGLMASCAYGQTKEIDSIKLEYKELRARIKGLHTLDGNRHKMIDSLINLGDDIRDKMDVYKFEHPDYKAKKD
jgi:uncharacterized coiled-coil DUF342 family protein